MNREDRIEEIALSLDENAANAREALKPFIAIRNALCDEMHELGMVKFAQAIRNNDASIGVPVKCPI